MQKPVSSQLAKDHLLGKPLPELQIEVKYLNCGHLGKINALVFN